MSFDFFSQPILNSPYKHPARHWELDATGQPTQYIVEKRRPAQFITPIPKPRTQKGRGEQRQLIFDEGAGVSSEEQLYDPTPVINELRRHVDQWRVIPNAALSRLKAEWRTLQPRSVSTVTLPVRFAGRKRRRLSVLVLEHRQSPPWGTWTTLGPEPERRSFTAIRAAINGVISPHEVDHVDFSLQD